MTLKEVQISEIKNIDLIYFFSTDSIFKGEVNKYIGATIVFNKNRVLSIDYKDKNFSEFVKRVLDRYDKEKDKGKIILLGSLTKKIVNDSSFSVLQQEKPDVIQSIGVPSFNATDRNLRQNCVYLKEAMKMIIQLYKNFELFSVDSITGFGHKYVINYSIGNNVKKQMSLLLFDGENGSLKFRISRVGNVSAPISGKIEQDSGLVNVTWFNDVTDLSGSIIYDALNDVAERQIQSNGITVVYDESKETILEEDLDIVDFYFNLCHLEKPSHILKTSDNSFLLADASILNDDENEVLYTNTGSHVDLDKDEARVSYIKKSGFSKYDNQINVTLEEEKEEITLRKIDIDNFILMERKKIMGKEESYEYVAYQVADFIDFSKPFTIVKTYNIDEEVKTLEMAKQYIRLKKAGDK